MLTPMPKEHSVTSLFVKDADKLTLGKEFLITTPHAIEGMLINCLIDV